MSASTSCALHSREVNEDLFGTLKPNRVYLLVEDPRPPAYDALAESSLPEAVRTKLSAVEGSSVLLIRRQGKASQTAGKRMFFIAVPQSASLYKFELSAYEDILSMDLDAVIAGEGAEPVDEPLFAVCTNGRRDTCCATHGVPVYEALAKLAPDTVWQSSHIGGHRFAGTMFCFPHALMYGRLDAEDAEVVLSSYNRGEILLDKYRGHAIGSNVLQAAGYFLRQQTGLLGLSDLQITSSQQVDDNHWTVDFRSTDGSCYRVSIARSISDYKLLKNCDDPESEWITMPRFSLTAVERD